jgi:hypothetical protein
VRTLSAEGVSYEEESIDEPCTMSLVLLAIIGTSAVFAQQPTLDKLSFTSLTNGYCAGAANKSISGAVVIPDTCNGRPVIGTSVSAFRDCTGITSVIIPNSVTGINSSSFAQCTGLISITIPASVTNIQNGAFAGCTNLTSVTLQGSTAIPYGSSIPGDFDAKYRAGGAGTYTRPAGSNTWTKQGGYTLSGTYTRSDGTQITITDNGQNVTITGNYPNNGGRINETLRR